LQVHIRVESAKKRSTRVDLRHSNAISSMKEVSSALKANSRRLNLMKDIPAIDVSIPNPHLVNLSLIARRLES